MTDSISQDKYSKELIKLDFPEKLIGSPETCRNLLEYCKKHDMKYLKKSDGLLVNTKFDKHFKVSECIKMRNPLENINLLRSKIEEKAFILISSPLEDLNRSNGFENYPYDIYVIDPGFLDYYAFIEDGLRHEEKINYAFTNAAESEMQNINDMIYIQHVNEMIYQDTGLSDVFKKYIF